MIAIMSEGKIKDHLRRNWKVYGIGSGALAAGVGGEEAADRLLGNDEQLKSAARTARVAGGLGAGWAMKKLYDKNKRRKITEMAVTADKTAEKTADVIEKTGGRRAVGHLRKHWKKYATLAGAGLAASLAGEGMRVKADRDISDIAKRLKDRELSGTSKRLTRGTVVDNLGTAVTVGAGAVAGAGKYYDRRKTKR